MASGSTKSPATVRVHRITAPLVRNLALLSDVLSITATGLLAYFAYLQPSWEGIDSRYVTAVITAGIIAGAMLRWLDVYRIEDLIAFWPKLSALVGAYIGTFAILLALAFSMRISDSFSRAWALVWLLSALLVLLATRYALARQVRAWARDGRFAERAVIVGAGENGQRLAWHLDQQAVKALRIVGFVDERTTRVPSSVERYPMLGNIDYLIQLIRDNQVDQVIIALPWSAEQRLQDLIYRLALTPAHIRLAPDFAGLLYADRPFVHQGGVAMLRVLDRPLSGWAYFTKRAEDVLLASIALFVLWPLLVGIWVAIRLDSQGPIVFRQERYGFNNEIIQVLKFRTMYVSMTDAGGGKQTARDDVRVTRVGRWLRRASLDELLQIFNVLRGEMSIVGPRAHPLRMTISGEPLESVVGQYAARHRVRPGITGWAQVNGLRGELDTVEKAERRLEYDLYYINNWSIWLDLLIIFKSVRLIIRDPNAY